MRREAFLRYIKLCMSLVGAPTWLFTAVDMLWGWRSGPVSRLQVSCEYHRLEQGVRLSLAS